MHLLQIEDWLVCLGISPVVSNLQYCNDLQTYNTLLGVVKEKS